MNNKVIINISKGVLISFIMTLIGIFIFATILTYSDISENIVPTVIIILTCISILIGSVIGARKISKNGLLHGGIIGGIYVIMLYLISSILNTGFVLNKYTIIIICAGIFSGIVGGIIGINT